MKRMKTGAVVLGAAALMAVAGTGTAVAGNLISGDDIAKNTITKREVGPAAIGTSELRPYVLDMIRQAGPAGADGKDGVSNLIAGAGYTDTFVGDNGAALQTARAECPAGQYALGGGYSTWGGDKDLGGDNKNIQITVSAPYFEGEYKPVDDAGNFRPTEWVVKGYNNGSADQIVRAWVTCADIAD